MAQCNEHEYSTSSLLDFSGEDISTKASLRCATCTAGKYSNKKGSGVLREVSKGLLLEVALCLSALSSRLHPNNASEECFPVDSQSFISWPASTLSDKRSAESSQCPTEAESRILASASKMPTANPVQKFVRGIEPITMVLHAK